MQHFDTLTLALEDIMDGNMGQREAQDWEVSNNDSPIIFNMIYGINQAVYGFIINQYIDAIVLTNFHRESLVKGLGTPTLQHIEQSLGEIATKRNKEIALMFQSIEDQPDTIVWLKKNKYQERNDIDDPGTIYYKIFSN
jgi:hypothetical protein